MSPTNNCGACQNITSFWHCALLRTFNRRLTAADEHAHNARFCGYGLTEEEALECLDQKSAQEYTCWDAVLMSVLKSSSHIRPSDRPRSACTTPSSQKSGISTESNCHHRRHVSPIAVAAITGFDFDLSGRKLSTSSQVARLMQRTTAYPHQRV
jgi:hypothetical protein